MSDFERTLPHRGKLPVTIPANIRGVNFIGSAFKKVGLPFACFDPEKLICHAQRDTGLPSERFRGKKKYIRYLTADTQSPNR